MNKAGIIKWHILNITLRIILIVLLIADIGGAATPFISHIDINTSEGLVAEYLFDEGSGNVVNDSSGNGNNGIIHSAVFVDGITGKALSFCGTSSCYIEIPGSNSLEPSYGLSIEFWVYKRNVSGGYETILRKANNCGAGYFIRNPGIRIDGNNPCGGETAIEVSANIPLNQWTHFVFTYDPLGGTKVYANSEQKQSQTIPIFSTLIHSGNLYIGGAPVHGDDWGLDGILDVFRIYNRALNASEIKDHYNALLTPPNESKIVISGVLSVSDSINNIGTVNWTKLSQRYYPNATGSNAAIWQIQPPDYDTNPAPSSLKFYVKLEDNVLSLLVNGSEDDSLRMMLNKSSARISNGSLTPNDKTTVKYNSRYTYLYYTLQYVLDNLKSESIISSGSNLSGNYVYKSSFTDRIYILGAWFLTTSYNADVPAHNIPFGNGIDNCNYNPGTFSCTSANGIAEITNNFTYTNPKYGYMIAWALVDNGEYTRISIDDTVWLKRDGSWGTVSGNRKWSTSLPAKVNLWSQKTWSWIEANYWYAVAADNVSLTGSTSACTIGTCYLNYIDVNTYIPTQKGTIEWNAQPLDQLANITISPDSVAVASGQTQQFTAIGMDANGNTISITPIWSSSNTIVGVISSSGIFTALSPGTTTITASSGTISVNASVKVTSGLVAEWRFEGDAQDTSGNGNHGTINGATFVQGVSGQALSFDGIDDYVDNGNNLSLQTSNVTVEGWIKTSDLSQHAPTIITKSRKGSDGYVMGTIDGSFFIEISHQGGWDLISTGIQADKWYHVAMTYENNKLIGYLNGEEFGNLSYNMATPVIEPLKIGHGYNTMGSWGTKGFNGIIDEVRIYNRALNASEIKAHYDVSVASTSGYVLTWGSNWYGQLGDNTTIDRYTPVKVNGISNVIAVAGGSEHSLALKEDGTVWAWGGNLYGQLGDNTTINRYTPVKVNGLSNVIAIAGRGLHSVALKNDGTVWTWGSNNYGQLGDGTTNNRLTPIQVNGLYNVIAIEGSYGHTISLKSDGAVWAWGLNGNGQLGDGTTDNQMTPVQVLGITNVTAVSGGMFHTIALKTDGTAWTWGFGGVGQLGNETYFESHFPVQVSLLSNVIAVSGGKYHNSALKIDGTVWTWGSYWAGMWNSTPTQMSELSNVIKIANGGSHTIALKKDGTLWLWGENGYGQLGDNTTTIRQTPVQIKELTNVFSVAGGLDHTIVVSNKSTVPTLTPIGTIISISDAAAGFNSSANSTIMVENVANLAAATIDLNYNPNIVNLLSVSAGDLGTVTSNIDNTAGKTTITAFSNTGKSGNITFASVVLKAVGSINATSPLTFSVAAISDQNATAIPYTIRNGTFTITATSKGDVNGDEQVNVIDALLISQYTVGMKIFTPAQLAAADVNNDGQVTIVDALFIAQFTVGLRQL